MATVSSVAFFESRDIFQHTMRFLNLEDLFPLERVCKSWEKAVIELRVLETLLEAENIPEIEDRRPNHKAYVVLKGMLERGVTVEKIRKYYGEPVFGKMPRVDPEKYKLMLQPDPEDPAKKMFETYEAVFTPLAIKRTFGKGLAATVDEEGRLKITRQKSSSEEYELEIPFSFPNLVELSKYPLAGKENGPVFDNFDDRVLEQCKSQATKAGIYFMRSRILLKSLSETDSQQEDRAEILDQEITPLIVRSLAHSTKILETGQCPDDHVSETYSRTADHVQISIYLCRVILGFFFRGQGVVVNRSSDASKYIGFAPGVSAEVQPSESIDEV